MINVGIVDDDALVRHTLIDLLSKNGDISVAWTAKDGREALDFFRSPETDEIQVALVDVQMPRMGGLTLAKALLNEDPNLAILILTTFTADSIVNNAMALGVRGFIAKEDGVSFLAGAIQQAAAGNLILSSTVSAVIINHARGKVGGSPLLEPTIKSPAEQESSSFPYEVRLSEREKEVLSLVIDARTNKQIASKLGLSEATIKTHISAIIAKLGVQDRVGAVVYALQHNLA
ncbi:response regulator transcription factor [Actinomyces sp. ZJ308]|uniref:response regulator transcription factor n=1 Tax=Actinomyces sp. ZJ308 TaxID=2708342 RepID=UPI001422F4B9|nr:response regulator transcription factor [Actinomyces sp. ZJ308]